jgi:hypothetical protein
MGRSGSIFGAIRVPGRSAHSRLHKWERSRTLDGGEQGSKSATGRYQTGIDPFLPVAKGSYQAVRFTERHTFRTG